MDPKPLIPEFDPTVGAVLEFLGVPAVLIILVLSYRSTAKPLTMWIALSFPYCLFAFGALSVAVITVPINTLFVLLALIGNRTPDWSMTEEYVLGNAYLTIDLICGIYCLAALASTCGARLARHLWTVEENSRPGSKRAGTTPSR